MTLTDLQKLKRDLRKLKNPEKAKNLERFFKTAKGEYGEGDRFFGLVMGQQRQLAKDYGDLSLVDLQQLLKIGIHEYRMVALLILVGQFKKAGPAKKKEIFDFYLKNTSHVNNWDLVDLSAPHIVGGYLLAKNRQILYKLAKSKSLWEKRISVLATFSFIRENQFQDALKISELLLNDEHDLIHKAVGWMLREVGKKNQAIEERFLKRYYHQMPRTMLRYAIERFDEKKRKGYLKR